MTKMLTGWLARTSTIDGPCTWFSFDGTADLMSIFTSWIRERQLRSTKKCTKSSNIIQSETSSEVLEACRMFEDKKTRCPDGIPHNAFKMKHLNICAI